MSKWIELAPKHIFFGSKLVCTSNIADLPVMNFFFKKRKMIVKTDKEIIIEVDNWRSLRVGNMVLVGKLKGLTLFGLVSEGLTLDFDWSVTGPAGFDNSAIICNGSVNDTYKVFNKFYPLTIMTKVRIESSNPNCNVHLMAGCLAYLWTFYELERIERT